MFTTAEKSKIQEYYNLALTTLKEKHIACFKGQEKPVFLISNTYPGAWLEHAYDSVFFAKLEPEYMEIAKNTLMMFMECQRENGQLPCYVIDRNKTQSKWFQDFGYSQTQECVSFARLCYEYYEMSGDAEFLKYAYDRCVKWEAWHEKYRMTGPTGLVEMFCGFDTGHDNSGRLEGITYQGESCGRDAVNYPVDDPVLPIIAPDINAVFYGTLTALADMAQALAKPEEAAEWSRKAAAHKEKVMEVCFDSDDCFFYDVDKSGKMRKYLSISITNVLTEHLPDAALADQIYEKHLRNEKEFWTEYPFPAMAKSDPSFRQNKSGNSWGFYSQALTILRCTRWMDFYGKSADFDYILEKWVRQWTFGNAIMFGQELHPLTGESSDCSAFYSSCMLVYIYAVRRLGLLK